MGRIAFVDEEYLQGIGDAIREVGGDGEASSSVVETCSFNGGSTYYINVNEGETIHRITNINCKHNDLSYDTTGYVTWIGGSDVEIDVSNVSGQYPIWSDYCDSTDDITFTLERVGSRKISEMTFKPSEMADGIRSAGEAASSGGEDIDTIVNGLLDGTYSGELNSDSLTSMPDYKFKNFINLTSVDMPSVTSVGSNAFYGCSSLKSANLPQCKTFSGTYNFYKCVLLEDITIPMVTSIPNYAFAYCESLTNIDLPVCTEIGSSSFSRCKGLMSIDLPLVVTIGKNSFEYCTGLVDVNMPKLTTINNYGYSLRGCVELKFVDLPVVTAISTGTFDGCYKLETLILRKSDAICTLGATTAFNNTPIKSGTGYIYVPAALIDTYKAATNWVTYAAQFRAIEDYPDICGGSDDGSETVTVTENALTYDFSDCSQVTITNHSDSVYVGIWNNDGTYMNYISPGAEVVLTGDVLASTFTLCNDPGTGEAEVTIVRE